MSKQALGKGLSALLSSGEDEQVNNENSQPQQILLSVLKAGSSQPREHFDEASLEELAESIRKNGILQPILVRKIIGSDFYEIIAGERRCRAAAKAGLLSVPVIVKEIDDRQALEFALIENIQRENLTAIEEADGYKRLQDEFSYTQEQLAGVLGKSRSHIANMLRLLSLPQSVKDLINSGAISMSHARVLVGSDNPQALAEKIVNEGLNVREVEKFAAGSGHAGGGKKGRAISGSRSRASNAQKDEDLLALEASLSDSMGLRVLIEDSSDGGRVVICFNNLTELDKILQKIG